MYEPADGLHAVVLHLFDHCLSEETSESGPSTVPPDGHDHQVPMGGEDARAFVLESLVSRHCDDVATFIRNHDPTIERSLSRVIAPGDETSNDLDDLIEPRHPGSRIERGEHGVVTRVGIAKDHGEERWMRVARVLGVRVVDGVGAASTRRPLARLRRGSTPSASAVRSRCRVDQRASRRSFSIREMSA